MKYKIIVAIALVVAVLGFSVAAFAMAQPTKPATASSEHEMKTAVQAPDSGVVTCQQMADRANMTGAKPKLSFADVRAKFEASQDEAIKTAGMKLIDTLIVIDAAQKSDEGTVSAADSLGQIMAMKVAWLDLQEACGKHGIDIPDLKV